MVVVREKLNTHNLWNKLQKRKGGQGSSAGVELFVEWRNNDSLIRLVVHV